MNTRAMPPRPNLSLLGRSAAIWLFGISLTAVLLVWVVESSMGVIQPSDRFAYPVLAVVLGGLLGMVWRDRRQVLRAQRIGTLAVCAYFLASVAAWGVTGSQGERGYAASTLGPWLLCAHLFIFITYRGRQALFIAGGFMAGIVMLPVLLAAASGRPSPWDATLWPIVVNMTIAQMVLAGILSGAARQVLRLADSVRRDGHSSMPATLSVDEVLTRRERDLERLLAASDQAKAQLEASEAELRAMFDAFPGAVCSVDAQGQYRYVNKYYSAMFGRKPADFAGQTAQAVIGRERWAASEARMARIAATGQPLTFEVRHAYPDGRFTDLLVTQYTVNATHGRPARHYAFSLDISDRKATELAMVDARFEAERANRAKSEVIAVVKHDLQAPMRAIVALAESLQHEPELGEPQREQARAIGGAGAKVLALVDDLK